MKIGKGARTLWYGRKERDAKQDREGKRARMH